MMFYYTLSLQLTFKDLGNLLITASADLDFASVITETIYPILPIKYILWSDKEEHAQYVRDWEGLNVAIINLRIASLRERRNSKANKIILPKLNLRCVSINLLSQTTQET
jgi:hypothetical protein